MAFDCGSGNRCSPHEYWSTKILCDPFGAPDYSSVHSTSSTHARIELSPCYAKATIVVLLESVTAMTCRVSTSVWHCLCCAIAPAGSAVCRSRCWVLGAHEIQEIQTEPLFQKRHGFPKRLSLGVSIPAFGSTHRSFRFGECATKLLRPKQAGKEPPCILGFQARILWQRQRPATNARDWLAELNVVPRHPQGSVDSKGLVEEEKAWRSPCR